MYLVINSQLDFDHSDYSNQKSIVDCVLKSDFEKNKCIFLRNQYDIEQLFPNTYISFSYIKENGYWTDINQNVFNKSKLLSSITVINTNIFTNQKIKLIKRKLRISALLNK